MFLLTPKKSHSPLFFNQPKIIEALIRSPDRYVYICRSHTKENTRLVQF